LEPVVLGIFIEEMRIKYLDDDFTKEYNKSCYIGGHKPWENRGTSVPLLTSQAPISGLFCKLCHWNFNHCKCPYGTKGKSYFRPDPSRISENGMYYTPEQKNNSEPKTNISAVVPHTIVKYLGFERRNWTYTQAKVLLDRGCVGCNNKYDTEAKVYWFSDSEYVCRDCKDNNEIIQADLKKVKIYGSGTYVERVN